jgi:ribosomal protein S18 acetylase RimI-like enzyme
MGAVIRERRNMDIRKFRDQDRKAVISLWQRCGLLVPWNHPDLDIDRKLQVQSELFLVGEIDGEIVATAMGGYEGHRGWINYLAVEPEMRGKGLGRMMMKLIEEGLSGMGCPKINLQVRESNLDVIRFYEKIGYSSDHVIGFGKRLSEDPPYDPEQE